MIPHIKLFLQPLENYQKHIHNFFLKAFETQLLSKLGI